MNEIIIIRKYKINSYLIDEDDMGIIYELFDNKFSKIVSKRKLKR